MAFFTSILSSPHMQGHDVCCVLCSAKFHLQCFLSKNGRLLSARSTDFVCCFRCHFSRLAEERVCTLSGIHDTMTGTLKIDRPTIYSCHRVTTRVPLLDRAQPGKLVGAWMVTTLIVIDTLSSWYHLSINSVDSVDDINSLSSLQNIDIFWLRHTKHLHYTTNNCKHTTYISLYQ